MLDLVRALRPYQWTKNALVFAALIFAQQLANPDKIWQAIGAFAIFCAASSSVYLLNDVIDRERDRQHPDKAGRPIASGAVSPTAALLTAVVLSAAALAGAWAISRELATTIGAYFLLQAAYNAGLKKIPIVDALCVAAGFLLRVVAGAAAIDEPMSSWLLICTTFVSVFVSFAKRRHEFSTLSEAAGVHRESLGGYSEALLDEFLVISAAATLLSYALYTTDAETVQKFGTSALILTLPFVMYGLFRYLALVHQGEVTGDPALAFLKDRPLLATVILWGLVVVAILYLR